MRFLRTEKTANAMGIISGKVVNLVCHHSSFQVSSLIRHVQSDELRDELKEKQNQALKYILTAARLIAPVLYHNFVEGYDWVVEGLKDQQYPSLANEMEMDKAIQHLHRRDFAQVPMIRVERLALKIL